MVYFESELSCFMNCSMRKVLVGSRDISLTRAIFGSFSVEWWKRTDASDEFHSLAIGMNANENPTYVKHWKGKTHNCRVWHENRF